MKPLTILVAASEMVPFVKTGGLADVIGALPKYLRTLGHEVHVFLPRYRAVTEDRFNLNKILDPLPVKMGSEIINGTVYEYRADSGEFIYFIDRKEYFDRDELYKTFQGDYIDNAKRFSFFCKAILEFCRQRDFRPDIMHLNDWQTGLVPVYLKLEPYLEFFKNTASVFTIHNIAYQGIFPKEDMPFTGLPWKLFHSEGIEFYGKMNFLKAGMVYSDVVNTVSGKYAEEIQTSEYGYGLDGILRKRKDSLYGIINGIDENVWNPGTDPDLVQNYSKNDLSGKEKCKEDLCSYFNMKYGPDVPLFGMITRLTVQKGLDLVVDIIEDFLRLKVQFILLGSGDKKYQDSFTTLNEQFPEKTGIKIGFDETLAHKIEAGVDFFIMPSRYEPAGLNQLYSLRYGALPVVRAVGGLDETIEDYNELTGEGTGIKFVDYTAKDLFIALARAIDLFHQKERHREVVLRGMSRDFTWKNSARKYVELYRKALIEK